ncbi:MAG: hypothetical protein LUE24_15115 [Lachnospiraceae bacterium]|nr:hypothetical protein [Lachnospiraceae bacterium]
MDLDAQGSLGVNLGCEFPDRCSVTMGRAAAKAEESICFFVDEIQYMKDDEMEVLLNALHRVNQFASPRSRS